MIKKQLLPWILCLALIAVLVMGADLKEKGGMQLLSSASVIIGDNNDTTLVELYTVPTGKNCIVEYVVLREPGGTLAGAVDVNFGIGAATTGDWIDGETGVADMTAATDYQVFERTNHISNEFTVIDGDNATVANRTFGIYIVEGADTDAETVTIDVFGYIW